MIHFFNKRENKLNTSPGFNKVLMILLIVANPILCRNFHSFHTGEGRALKDISSMHHPLAIRILNGFNSLELSQLFAP